MANMADHILRLLQTVTGENPKELPEVKSLRWLANMWPMVEKPKDDADRMSTCIHLYCTAAADRMVQMSEAVDFARTINAENVRLKAELEKVKAERDAAVADIEDAAPCFACKNFRRNGGQCIGGNKCREDILECEMKAQKYTGPEWEWRGANHGKADT